MYFPRVRLSFRCEFFHLKNLKRGELINIEEKELNLFSGNKTSIEKEIEELGQQETDISKEQLNIAKAKIDALDSNYYEKI